jgi:hypothetical protein
MMAIFEVSKLQKSGAIKGPLLALLLFGSPVDRALNGRLLTRRSRP